MTPVVSYPRGHYGRLGCRGHGVPLRLRCDPIPRLTAAASQRGFRTGLGLHHRSQGRADLHQEAWPLIRGLIGAVNQPASTTAAPQSGTMLVLMSKSAGSRPECGTEIW